MAKIAVTALKKDTVFKFEGDNQEWAAMRRPTMRGSNVEVAYTAYPTGFAKYKTVPADTQVTFVKQD